MQCFSEVRSTIYSRLSGRSKPSPGEVGWVTTESPLFEKTKSSSCDFEMVSE